MAQPPGGDFYMTTIEMQLFLKSYLIWMKYNDYDLSKSLIYVHCFPSNDYLNDFFK